MTGTLFDVESVEVAPRRKMPRVAGGGKKKAQQTEVTNHPVHALFWLSTRVETELTPGVVPTANGPPFTGEAAS